MHIRFSQARLSSTVLPLLEKFIINRATLAVTMAVIVEISRIWLYTSCMISCAFVHISVDANTGHVHMTGRTIQKHRTPGTCRAILGRIFLPPVSAGCFFFSFIQTSFAFRRAKKEEHPGIGNAPLSALFQYDVICVLLLFSIPNITYGDLRRNGRSLLISCQFCFRSADGRSGGLHPRLLLPGQQVGDRYHQPRKVSISRYTEPAVKGNSAGHACF